MPDLFVSRATSCLFGESYCSEIIKNLLVFHAPNHSKIMKTIKCQCLALAAFVLFATQLAAQNISRSIENFEKLAVSGSFEVHAEQGNTPSVRLELSGNIDADMIVTEVRGNTLHISYERWVNNVRGKAKIYVTFNQLTDITNSGASNIFVKSTLKTDRFSVTCSGSGKVEVDIDARDVKTVISGSGSISMGGKAESQSVTISGSGSMNALEMASKSADIRLSGSGRAQVQVSDELTVSASGSGNVKYRGNPSRENIKISGSGRVVKI